MSPNILEYKIKKKNKINIELQRNIVIKSTPGKGTIRSLLGGVQLTQQFESIPEIDHDWL